MTSGRDMRWATRGSGAAGPYESESTAGRPAASNRDIFAMVRCDLLRPINYEAILRPVRIEARPDLSLAI